jgi:glutamyl-Q tRNA(Asp) synthetase
MPNSFDDHSPLKPPSPYIGRFAPSPTGLLHFGSLVSALASYLDAHHNNGQWFLRMEDIDPPREQPGAASAILRSLEDHGLYWDGPVTYQSQRLSLYADYLNRLERQEVIYRCSCSRQDLAVMGNTYNGRCRLRHVDVTQSHSLRLKLYDLAEATTDASADDLRFTDLVQGVQIQNLRTHAGDQIVKRKDGLFAYQLAVVVDDIEQKVSRVIRGSDLLEVTARQIFLFQLLKAKVPQFGHVTLATHLNGQKLSKQNLAPPLESQDSGANICKALIFLGQDPPKELHNANATELLDWGKQYWQLTYIKELSATI